MNCYLALTNVIKSSRIPSISNPLFNFPLSFHPGVTESGLARDEMIENVATDILRKLPKLFEIDRIKKAFQMNITPTGVVLLQELERFNKLLNRMQWTLSQLTRALAGEIGMDTILDTIANSLFNGQIPDDWRKLAPQTCKQLGGWMDHLLVSKQFFSVVHILHFLQLLPFSQCSFDNNRILCIRTRHHKCLVYKMRMLLSSKGG